MTPLTKYAGSILCALTLMFAGGCAELTTLAGQFGGSNGLELLQKVEDGAEKVEGATLGNAAKGVDKYCDKVPGASRTLFRDRFNGRAEMDGAMLGIWCPGDAPLTLGP